MSDNIQEGLEPEEPIRVLVYGASVMGDAEDAIRNEFNLSSLNTELEIYTKDGMTADDAARYSVGARNGQFDVVVLSFGGNDLLLKNTPIAEVEYDLERLINNYQKEGIKVVLVGLNPDDFDHFSSMDSISMAHGLLKLQVPDIEEMSAPVKEMYERLSEKVDYLYPSLYDYDLSVDGEDSIAECCAFSDGIHLTREGSDILGGNIVTFLENNVAPDIIKERESTNRVENQEIKQTSLSMMHIQP